MQIKPGADIRFLRWELVRYLPQMEAIFRFHEPAYIFTITSGRDGEHSRNSKHYKDGAIDVRRWYPATSAGPNIPAGPVQHVQLTTEQLNAIVSDLHQLLGDDFDIVLERTHIHIEFDP